jgi:hypothetical protein
MKNPLQVVLVLWLLSAVGNFCSSITLAYIGMSCANSAHFMHHSVEHAYICLSGSSFWNLTIFLLMCMTGIIALVTIPALYNKYQRHVDRYAGMVHRNISRHYKIVDENVISRLPRSFVRDKDEWLDLTSWICGASQATPCISNIEN